MKTAAIAATAILALLVAGVAATASAHQFMAPSAGQPNSSAVAASQTNKGQNGDRGRGGDFRGQNKPLNLTVGETLTLSGLTGMYRSVTNSSVKGNASGTLAVKVTAAFKSGYLLAISSGTLTLGKVSYTVAGGTVELIPFALTGTGSGTTSSSGQFLIQLSIHGTTASPVGRAVLDLEAGGSEYLVTIGTPDGGGQGSH